jgi:plasmid maintenance system killer protein
VKKKRETLVIKSFSDKLTESIFNGIHTHGVHKNFSSNQMKEIERKLDILNCAESLDSLHLIPSIKAEVVRDAHGKHSLPINKEWRLAFGWNDGPENVEIKSC